jgi:hypothetical protein
VIFDWLGITACFLVGIVKSEDAEEHDELTGDGSAVGEGDLGVVSGDEGGDREFWMEADVGFVVIFLLHISNREDGGVLSGQFGNVVDL